MNSEAPPPMTLGEIKNRLRQTFEEAWKREIEDDKPNEEITSEELVRWTSAAAAKMELAIRALIEDRRRNVKK